MNKKKRALALGMAATQLSALSAVVSPLTAFAATETVSAAEFGIDSPGSMAGDSTGLQRYQDNKKCYSIKSALASKAVELDVQSGKMKGEAAKGGNAKNVCLVLTLDSALAKGSDGNYSFAASDGYTVEQIDVTDGHQFVNGGNANDVGKYVVLWIQAPDGETKTMYFGGAGTAADHAVKVVLNDTTAYTVKLPTSTANYTVSQETIAAGDPDAGKVKITVTPAANYQFAETDPVVSNITGLTFASGTDASGNAVYTATVDPKSLLTDDQKKQGVVEVDLTASGALTVNVEAEPVEVTVSVDDTVTFGTVKNEEAQLVADAKTALEAKLSSLIKFADGSSSSVSLIYDTDYKVTVGEGTLDSTNKDKVTFPLTVSLTEAGKKKAVFASNATTATVNVEVSVTVVNVAGLAVTTAANCHLTYALTDNNGDPWGDKKVKENDTVKLVVTPDEGYELKTAPTVTMNSAATGVGAGSQGADGKWTYVLTIQSIANGTTSIPVNIADAATEIPTATITTDTTGLTGAANADVELFESDGTTPLADGKKLKNGDSFVVKITPKEGYEFLTANAPKYKLGGGAENALTKESGGSYKATVNITGLTTAGNTATTLTLTGEVTKKPVVNVLKVYPGIEDAPAMAGNANLSNYNDNLAQYEVPNTMTEDADGNYTITIPAAYGAMKGDNTKTDADGKNVLLVLEMEKVDGLKVLQNGGEITDALVNADKFISGADAAKTYATLWTSITDARLADGFAGVVYTLQAGSASKTVTIKFTDTTEYGVTGTVNETNYTASATLSADKKTAAITVEPVGSNILTSAEVKLADSTTVTLKPSGKNYTGEVEIKKLLTAAEIKNGTVTKALTANDFTVAAKAQSNTVKVDSVMLAVAESDSLDAAGLANYQHNRDLIEGQVNWDAANNITTVKVPSALLKGTNNTTGTGTNEKNICLLMKFQTPLTYNGSAASNKWGVNASQIADIDVEDGWKFAGATAADKGLYAVLWINASEAALNAQDGNKVVIYEDGTGAAITTVSLVKVEAVKPSDVSGISAVALDADAAEADNVNAIVDAVKTKLGANKAALVDIAVTGEIPEATDTAQNNVNVEVTLTAKTGAEVVLADADDKKAANIKFNVPVNMPAVTTYTVTLPASTADGSVTADKASAPAGAMVTLTVTPATGKELGTLTVKDGANNDVECTPGADGKYTFTMPAGNVNVTATFTAEAEKFDVTVGAATNGTVTVDKAKAKEGETVTITAAPTSGYKVGSISVKQGTTTIKVTNNKFTMPAGNVTVTVTFTKKSSGGSSGSGGGHYGGGSSSGSSSSILSNINSSSKGDTVEAPYGTTILLSSMLDSAADNGVLLSVPVNSTYTWTIDPAVMESTDSSIILSVTETTVKSSEVAKVEGKPITDTMAFTTQAKNLGKAAKLTISTPVRSTADKTKFANFYKIKSDGTLEFVDVVPIDKSGKATLPISDVGSYSILISDETKKTGDVDNNCKVDLNDLSAALELFVNAPKTITRSENFKLDYDNSGVVHLDDISKMLKDFVNGKLK